MSILDSGYANERGHVVPVSTPLSSVKRLHFELIRTTANAFNAQIRQCNQNELHLGRSKKKISFCNSGKAKAKYHSDKWTRVCVMFIYCASAVVAVVVVVIVNLSLLVGFNLMCVCFFPIYC